MQRIFEYAESNYDNECRMYGDECPYRVKNLEPEFLYKQVYTWFITEKVLPSTGKTVLDEFVEKYLENDPELARKMLQMKDVIRGSFKVIDLKALQSGFHLVSVEHLETGRKYEVISTSEEPQKFFTKGSVIVQSRIHPWGERYCRFAGILTREMSDEEFARKLGLVSPQLVMDWYERRGVEEAESITVGPNCALHAVMNKYPSQWVDGVCVALGISERGKKREKVKCVVSKLESGYVDAVLKKLPRGSLEALKMLVEAGFMLRYGALTKRFSAEVGLWWKENPPKSEIGLLRLNGLVVVGRMPMGGRLYKVAIIPLEVRAPLKRFFATGVKSDTSP